MRESPKKISDNYKKSAIKILFRPADIENILLPVGVMLFNISSASAAARRFLHFNNQRGKQRRL
jgi:hypothetical protein